MSDLEPKIPYDGANAAFHTLLVGRIYHEDNLFAQRTYALLAVHAFLLTAFTVLVTSKEAAATRIGVPLTWWIGTPLSLFGALLGIFQAAFGRQTGRAVGLWREYLRLVEKKWGIPFDHIQYEFYHDAQAQTPFGEITRSRPRQKSLYQSFRIARFFTAITTMVGVFFPGGLALFWAAVFAYGLFELFGSCVASVVVFLLFLALELFVLARPLAAAVTKESRSFAPSD